jgi:SAM-dependent methyltransferase
VIVMRSAAGDLLPLRPERWLGEADGAEARLLGTVVGPVLDVGCGPGRVVSALSRRGIPALGVDPAPAAIDLARGRGAAVLQRSVFDRLPGEGRWRTIVLLDGNVGIGGDVLRLLLRCRSLIAADGTVLVELEGPGSGIRRCQVRLECDAETGPWFPWAVVGVDAIGGLAAGAGLRLADVETAAGRWVARLECNHAVA